MEGPDGLPDGGADSRAHSAGAVVGGVRRSSAFDPVDQVGQQELPGPGLRVAIAVCPWVPMLHGLDPSSSEASSGTDPSSIVECVAIKDKTSIEIRSQASSFFIYKRRIGAAAIPWLCCSFDGNACSFRTNCNETRRSTELKMPIVLAPIYF